MHGIETLAAPAMTPLWLQALLFGLFSALSLPLGALLGLALAPVSGKVTAQWMAFGGGALVFAVATQLNPSRDHLILSYMIVYRIILLYINYIY